MNQNCKCQIIIANKTKNLELVLFQSLPKNKTIVFQPDQIWHTNPEMLPSFQIKKS